MTNLGLDQELGQDIHPHILTIGLHQDLLHTLAACALKNKNGLATLSTSAPWLFTCWLVPHGVGAIQSAEIHQTEGGTPEIARANRGRSSEPLPLPEGFAGAQGAENTQKWQSGGWLYRCTPQLQSSKLQLTEGRVLKKALQGQQGVLSEHYRRPNLTLLDRAVSIPQQLSDVSSYFGKMQRLPELACTVGRRCK